MQRELPFKEGHVRFTTTTLNPCFIRPEAEFSMSLNRETTVDNTQFSIDVFKGSVVNKICHSVNEESLVMSSSV